MYTLGLCRDSEKWELQCRVYGLMTVQGWRRRARRAGLGSSVVLRCFHGSKSLDGTALQGVLWTIVDSSRDLLQDVNSLNHDARLDSFPCGRSILPKVNMHQIHIHNDVSFDDCGNC